MKKLLIYSFSILAFAACEEGENGLFDKKDNPCPTVSSEDVPTAVKAAQERDYAGIAVTTWFNVDGKGYTALFIKDATETKVYYDNSGAILKTEVEEIDVEENDAEENDGEESDDEESDDDGCECDLNEEH